MTLGPHGATLRRSVLRATLVVTSVATLAHAGLPQLEAELESAVSAMDLATVVLVPRGAAEGTLGCSGVLVTAAGHVLTSDLVGRTASRRAEGEPTALRLDDLDVRVPDPATKTFKNYRGRVIARATAQSAAVVVIDDGPKGGFKSVLEPATAEHLKPGSFAFVAGNSFGFSNESTPTLTAGIVATVERESGADQEVRSLRYIYTTAAVNPGVAGGPVVDARGQLVGLATGWVDVIGESQSPLQLLGRVTPIDRVRRAFAGNAEAAAAFAAPPRTPASAPPANEESSALETVFAAAGAATSPSVVSLEIERSSPLSSTTLVAANRPLDLPRYRGAVSAVVASADGLIVTSLYNLTNLTTLTSPQTLGMLPVAAHARAGVLAITGAKAHLRGGQSVPAALLAVDEGLGIALFRAELPPGTSLRVPPVAAQTSFQAGRFALIVANPFGKHAHPDPFLTTGVLSKLHRDDALDPWRGQWQTDARGTDGNCGGAAVDIRGGLLGVLTLWDVAQQGRSSGIAYIVPWEKIAAALPALARGESARRPFLGVQWADPSGASTAIALVLDGSAAKAAGVSIGDVIVSIDGVATKTRDDCMRRIAVHSAGDVIALRVLRGTATVELTATLGTRE